MEVIPVIHNVSSVQRVVDMARLVYSLGYDTLIVTKAYGGAAQSGIPEAMRIALRENKRLIVLPELSDAVELLKPDQIFIVTKDYSEEHLDPAKPPRLEGRILIAFSGSDPDFSIQEARLGRPIYLKGIEGGRLGPLAEAGIILYALKGRD
ncbi:MAG: RecB-family nuclease [Desulfurococcales archaeon]|nr:RecB-family nuclease [Desulfurococcales archaeon]